MRKLLFVLPIIAVLFFSNCKEEEKIVQPSIDYPSSGLYGDNILDTLKTNYSEEEFSLAANLSNGAELTIKISALGEGVWFYALGTKQNWIISNFNESTKSQEFTAINTDQKCDLQMELFSGQYRIEYFEFNSGSATREKVIEK